MDASYKLKMYLKYHHFNQEDSKIINHYKFVPNDIKLSQQMH